MSSTEESLMTATPTSGAAAGIPPTPVDSSDFASMLPALPNSETPPSLPAPKRAGNYKGSTGRRRTKPPKDSKVFKAALACLAMRAQGLGYEEISEQLGLAKSTLQQYLKIARRKGYLNIQSFDGAEDKLENVIKDQVANNLHELVNERVDETNVLTARAGEITLEVAKGTGLLKQHQVVKTDGQTNVGFALRVVVETAPGYAPAVRPGAIGGTPAINAEIIESE